MIFSNQFLPLPSEAQWQVDLCVMGYTLSLGATAVSELWYFGECRAELSPNSTMLTSSWRFATSARQTYDIPIDLCVTSPTFPCLVADVADFPVSPTQTYLLPTCHGNFSNHVDMSRWFKIAKHPRDLPVTWSMSPTSPKLPRDTCHGEVSGKLV